MSKETATVVISWVCGLTVLVFVPFVQNPTVTFLMGIIFSACFVLGLAQLLDRDEEDIW